MFKINNQNSAKDRINDTLSQNKANKIGEYFFAVTIFASSSEIRKWKLFETLKNFDEKKTCIFS